MFQLQIQFNVELYIRTIINVKYGVRKGGLPEENKKTWDILEGNEGKHMLSYKL